MFTGIIEEMGSVHRVEKSGESFALTLAAALVLEGTRLGDSIAVNGVCLTVTHLTAGLFSVGVAPETLSRTNLGGLKVGDRVNLERAVTPQTRLGGHYVQGHIDATGTLAEFRTEKDSLWVTIQAPPEVMKYVVPKGFIALDGVSLTVVEVRPNWFSVMLVSYTQAHISLPSRKPGYPINIEVDILGKYVERLLQPQLSCGGITADLLKEHGFNPNHRI